MVRLARSDVLEPNEVAIADVSMEPLENISC